MDEILNQVLQSTSYYADNFAMTWPSCQDGVFEKRDFEALNKLVGKVESLEEWMRRVDYDETENMQLKGMRDRMDEIEAVSKSAAAGITVGGR
jgi:hypothetical protein